VSKQESEGVMAAGGKPKKQAKRSLTVRERREQVQPQKQRIIQRTAKGAGRPFRAIGRFLAKVLSPFRFLLWPFKTRPVRFIGRVLAAIFFLGYFRGAWQELRQVTWPDRKQTWQLTFAVFVFAVIFGIMITVTDYGLDKLFKKVILK
jgi:preprotein translocase SecE subunit